MGLDRNIPHRFCLRHYLTLIEMMVVLAIISLIAAVISYNVSKGIRDQRFRSEVGLIVDKLRLAQNLMLILNEDVEVHFQKVEQGISYYLTFQCPLKKGWDRELTRKSRLLTGVKDVEFHGEEEKRNENELILRFCSSGMVMSRGVLSVFSDSGLGQTRYICLQGYPHPIYAVDRNEGLFCLYNQQNELQGRLTQFIVPEIEAKLQVLNKPSSNPTNSPTNPPEKEKDKTQKSNKTQ